ncbi:MAG: nucleotidyl transferase AbiEii/AbiGii toxin family protein [Chitinophagaceae bacterium]|nr:nucleotidyl transferase AbiEii/AbiGii toxin family protein [Chitinophagaceae bacterium]MCW5915340.1 nucleotidyl transferase AbiEii/AbiGii toxin family protein [Chitinophagaceae bacterium]
MLPLSEILKEYPQGMSGFRTFIIREYLQYKILQAMFESRFANQFCFLGGTCLRIVHGNNRFSEDLDFDNFNIPEKDFKEVSIIIVKELEKEGYEVEMKTIIKSAYHCIIKIPEILHAQGLSGHREEKILIQLDTEPQQFSYTPEKVILNKFDVFTQIFTTPLDLLLAQKFYAILHRKRNKGRDFYDVVFLLSKVKKPNYDYLEMKTGIKDGVKLKSELLNHCSKINMEEMARDVQPFLFSAKDVNKVTLFTDYIRQVAL